MIVRMISRAALPAATAVALLMLAGCNREPPPTYAPPPPPPTYAPPPPPPAYEPPAAAAAPTSERMTIARACAPDIERFCAGVPPRQGMIKECMKAHVTELSAGCFDAVMSAVAAEHAP